MRKIISYLDVERETGLQLFRNMSHGSVFLATSGGVD